MPFLEIDKKTKKHTSLNAVVHYFFFFTEYSIPVELSSVCLSVCLSVNIFKLEYLRNQ